MTPKRLRELITANIHVHGRFDCDAKAEKDIKKALRELLKWKEKK